MPKYSIIDLQQRSLMCVRRELCEKTAEKKAKTEEREETEKADKTEKAKETKETEKITKTEESARSKAGQNGEKLCLKMLS